MKHISDYLFEDIEKFRDVYLSANKYQKIHFEIDRGYTLKELGLDE